MSEISKKMRFWIVISVVAIGWGLFLDNVLGIDLNNPGQLVIGFGPGAIAIIGWTIWWVSKGK